MDPLLRADTIRAAEEAWFADHPGADLMAVAASAVGEVAADMLAAAASGRADHPGQLPSPGISRPSVLVVAGTGNNAGDALRAAAALTARTGTAVDLLIWPVRGHSHPQGMAEASAAGARTVSAEEAVTLATSVDLLIDGVSGLGGRPGLPEPILQLAQAAAAAGTPVLAVDLPSGLCPDLPTAFASFHATGRWRSPGAPWRMSRCRPQSGWAASPRSSWASRSRRPTFSR